MPRKKKEVVETVETPVPMKEDAMNPPVEQEEKKEKVQEDKPVYKKVACGNSRVNCRDEAEGEVLFTISNYSKVHVVEEKDGWTKVVGWIKSELLVDI